MALLAIVALIATQPLASLGHIVHDHLGEHAHAAHATATHLESEEAVDHDVEDHHHVWITAAVTLQVAQLTKPQVIAAAGVLPDRSCPSAAPLPPFSPPRA